MLPRLLVTAAAASALGPLPPDCGVATWRAGPSLVRVELDRGGKLNALTRSMWEALDAVLEDTDDALLITSGDAKAFSAGADVNAVASEPVDERRDFLRLEYETQEVPTLIHGFARDRVHVRARAEGLGVAARD